MATEISNIETEWIPPHGLAKGYPWNGIVTKNLKKVVYAGSVHPMEKPLEEGVSLEEALQIAEEQIEDMQKENPFTPEDFGFEAIVKPQDTTDVPITIYQSRFDENVIIFRKSKSDYGWTIQQKQPEGTMPPIKDIDVTLPCERIAYALFYALGIKVEE